MSEAKRPRGAAGVVKADAPRIRPYRREKLRAFSHDAVHVTQELLRARGDPLGLSGDVEDGSLRQGAFCQDLFREGVTMLDHISLAVADFERARAFYDQVLAALGHRRVMEITDVPNYVAAGYGASEHEPAFWIGASREPGSPAPQPPDGQHVAFAAATRAMVDAFYEAALRAGAGDNGPPGIREHYHPDYYACFVIDPDGYHLEAVCHRPA